MSYSVRKRHARRIRVVCWILLAAFWLTSIPPVWALPDPPPARVPAESAPTARPQDVQLDPLVRKILAQSGQGLDVPPGLPGEAGDLYPDLLAALPEASPTCGCNSTWMGTPSATPEVQPTPEATPTPVPTPAPAGPLDPPAWMVQPSPSPARPKSHSPSPGSAGGSRSSGPSRAPVPGAEPEEPETHEPAPTQSTRPHLPLLEPGSDDRFAPEWEVSRQAQPRGPFLPADHDASCTRRAMSTDAFMLVSKAFTPTNPGKDEIYIDFYSPVERNNATSRGTAASYKAVYKARGASPSALDSSYTLEVFRYDRRSPHGARVWRKSEDLQLPQIDCVAAVTPTDLGRWRVRVTHNGRVQPEIPICLEKPILPLQEGWSRRTAMRMDHLQQPLVAYTGDEGLFYRTIYKLPKLRKDPKKRQPIQAKASWSWRAPEGRWNSTGGRYMRFEAYYSCEKDGRWSLVEKVFDRVSPHGRLWQQRSGTKPPATVDLVFGKALPIYGTWGFEEKDFLGRRSHDKIRVHEVVTKVSTLSRGLHPELGRVPFILSVETPEKHWISR